MDRLVDHLLVMEGDGVIRDFPGNYTQYRYWQQEQQKRPETSNQQQNGMEEKKSENTAMASMVTPSSAIPSEKRKMSYKEKREWEQIDKELMQLNQEKGALLLKMSNPDLPFSEMDAIGKKMLEVQTLIDTMEMRWLELSELLPTR
jgi:ATP-binding cassette subfamily F protein uup